MSAPTYTDADVIAMAARTRDRIAASPRLAAGLTPEVLSEYDRQRARWAEAAARGDEDGAMDAARATYIVVRRIEWVDALPTPEEMGRVIAALAAAGVEAA